MTQEVQNNLGIYVGKDIPEPLVDIAMATKISKNRLHDRRNLSETRDGNKLVIDKHASRARRSEHKNLKVKVKDTSSQLTLEF
jgi:deoxyribodipyrimidine photo-lyase